MRRGSVSMIVSVIVLPCCVGEFGAERGSSGKSYNQVDREADESQSEVSCEGLVDDECSCELGHLRDCYPGPAETAGVGVCRPGTQRCEASPEGNVWTTCVGAVLASEELPENELDEDCDGIADEPCPNGSSPTYHRRLLVAEGGGSYILPGDGQPRMTMTCEAGTCGNAYAAVALERLSGYPISDYFLCVSPPPECTEGLDLTFSEAGGWDCEPPCEIIVHYGGLYGNKTVCTHRPTLACTEGNVPTFVFETEAWECRPVCDNGLYDQIWFENTLMCVPC